MIHLCLCSKYEHFLNIYASRDSITQIYAAVFQCSFVTWFDGYKKNETNNRHTYANIFEFVFQTSDGFFSILLLFPPERNHDCMSSCLIMLNERIFLRSSKLFNFFMAFREKLLQTPSHFVWQMGNGNHLTLLTSGILHSNVNLTQNFFLLWVIFVVSPPFIRIKKKPKDNGYHVE